MRIVFAVCLIIATFLTHAQTNVESDPNQVIHSVSVNTFARINADKEKLQAQPDHIRVIIEEQLIPYFDYKFAAYKVMGSHLKNTTREQRDQFVEAFKTYLINAYGHILFEYDQQEVEILDNRHFQGKRIITIPVKIRDKNDNITQIAFKLRKNKKTGEWKVFDVIAEGISMLDTKQSELNELIHKHGVDYVITLLEKKNSEF
ncbi:ABC transporter substrate-binding protein [Psychromonas sp. psych-6C06]|uniref:MlaC/ttg2D family ABC transporter substrate-binding protein n=1 Tax=Psychromonas sp. psych-6C06 TaxID=2058089 RepID=UPI000C337177|nr:ABC transporter substrate-binding protein [Psychromonas sp. psych-6C06]PKF60467.1 ABC transporter substrate-binding protein [Psychromonas sp. psych-6C06]